MEGVTQPHVLLGGHVQLHDNLIDGDRKDAVPSILGSSAARGIEKKWE